MVGVVCHMLQKVDSRIDTFFLWICIFCLCFFLHPNMVDHQKKTRFGKICCHFFPSIEQANPGFVTVSVLYCRVLFMCIAIWPCCHGSNMLYDVHHQPFKQVLLSCSVRPSFPCLSDFCCSLCCDCSTCETHFVPLSCSFTKTAEQPNLTSFITLLNCSMGIK